MTDELAQMNIFQLAPNKNDIVCHFGALAWV